MAYKNLVAEAVATREEIFKRFRDWMCKRNGSYDYSVTGLGWTLHDAVYAVDENTLTANDYFVMYSAGESGKDDLYFKVVYSSSAGYIQILMYQYWNNSTHAGVNGMSVVNNWLAGSAAGALYLYGSLDNICAFTVIGTAYYGTIFGVIDDAVYDRTVAISAAAVSAGSGVVVTLDSVPAAWVVGGTVVVRDNANIERITISAISGLTVTFSTVAASYASGCKFAKDYPVICNNSSNVLADYKVLFDHANTKQASINPQVVPAYPGSSGNPDPLDGEYLATPYQYYNDTGCLGCIGSILGTIYTGFTHLAVYTTAAGISYRSIALFSGHYALLKEV